MLVSELNFYITFNAGLSDEQTVDVLELFHKVPLWFKSKLENNRAAKVLEVYPVSFILSFTFSHMHLTNNYALIFCPCPQEGTTPDEMRPNARDPPRLLALKVENSPHNISCYLDTIPFFTSVDPVESLLYLLAMYFIFDIKWPTNCRLPFVSLAACTIGAAKVASHIGRNNQLKDLLAKWKVQI